MDVYKTNIGQKDMQKGLFAVWKDIFQVTTTRQSAFKRKYLVLIIIYHRSDVQVVAYPVPTKKTS